MLDYELHADFDRNGVLSRSPAEHAQRSMPPGAILVANLDAERRKLPTAVMPGDPVKLDLKQPTKTGDDNELLQLEVRVNKPSATIDSRFFLVLRGELVGRVRLYDRQGHEIAPASAGSAIEKRFPLDVGQKTLELLLECQTLLGSPLGGGAAGRKSGLIGAEGQLNLTLLSVDAGKRELQRDQAMVSIAPYIVSGNHDKVLRLYLCELADNEPSWRDVRAALGNQPGIYTPVPKTISDRDAWLQDQYQHGVVEGPAGRMQVVVHLPRFRVGALQSQTAAQANLAGFVTSHFPSKDIGLFQEFWEATLPVTTTDGSTREIDLAQSFDLLLRAGRIDELYGALSSLRINFLKLPLAIPPDAWSTQLRDLDDATAEVIAGLQDLEAKAQGRYRLLLQELRKAVSTLLRDIQKDFPTTDQAITLPLGKQSAAVADSEADRLLERVSLAHSSHNYGGNLVATAPVKGAPLGKLVVGNVRQSDGKGNMDPALLEFFRSQVQPLVEIDTTWLKVGHIDEIISFVAAKVKPGFAMLRAAPGVAMKLLRAAQTRFRDGLDSHDPGKTEWKPAGIALRTTSRGATPVTMMMRGQLWLHEQPKGALESTAPAHIYQRMAAVNTELHPLDGLIVSGFDMYFQPGETDQPRFYPARITIEEFLYFERDASDQSVNDFIEQEILAPIEQQLGKALDDLPVVRVPVLFDRIPSLDAWKDGARYADTLAFLPDLVNLQVVNGTLLIPKPFGPRMRPADAIAVVSEVLEGEKLGRLKSKITPQWLRMRGLDQTQVWVEPQPPRYVTINAIGGITRIFYGQSTSAELAEVFADGFPGMSREEVIKKIVTANSQHFLPDGRLREGWHRLTIPENTVDLFEVYAQVVLEELGLTVRWVDSWFYHVRAGGIHCGTNVLRDPVIKKGALAAAAGVGADPDVQKPKDAVRQEAIEQTRGIDTAVANGTMKPVAGMDGKTWSVAAPAGGTCKVDFTWEIAYAGSRIEPTTPPSEPFYGLYIKLAVRPTVACGCARLDLLQVFRLLNYDDQGNLITGTFGTQTARFRYAGQDRSDNLNDPSRGWALDTLPGQKVPYVSSLAEPGKAGGHPGAGANTPAVLWDYPARFIDAQNEDVVAGMEFYTMAVCTPQGGMPTLLAFIHWGYQIKKKVVTPLAATPDAAAWGSNANVTAIIKGAVQRFEAIESVTTNLTFP